MVIWTEWRPELYLQDEENMKFMFEQEQLILLGYL